MYITVFNFCKGGVLKKLQKLIPYGSPSLMQTAGMFVITFGKTQKTFLIFIHTLNSFNDIGKISVIGIAGKDIAPFPAQDAFDKSCLGKCGEQLPKIFIGNPQGLDKMMGGKNLQIQVDHIT